MAKCYALVAGYIKARNTYCFSVLKPNFGERIVIREQPKKVQTEHIISIGCIYSWNIAWSHVVHTASNAVQDVAIQLVASLHQSLAATK
jgi:hypothetical protein